MATTRKESALVKEKRGKSPSTSQPMQGNRTIRQPKPADHKVTPNALRKPSPSNSKSKLVSSPSDPTKEGKKDVPVVVRRRSFDRPTPSSYLDPTKKKPGPHDDSTQKPHLIRRRSLDRPPLSSRQQSSHIPSPSPQEKRISRSTSLSAKTVTLPKPLPDRTLRSPLSTAKRQPPPAQGTRGISLSGRKEPPRKKEANASASKVSSRAPTVKVPEVPTCEAKEEREKVGEEVAVLSQLSKSDVGDDKEEELSKHDIRDQTDNNEEELLKSDIEDNVVATKVYLEDDYHEEYLSKSDIVEDDLKEDDIEEELSKFEINDHHSDTVLSGLKDDDIEDGLLKFDVNDHHSDVVERDLKGDDDEDTRSYEVGSVSENVAIKEEEEANNETKEGKMEIIVEENDHNKVESNVLDIPLGESSTGAIVKDEDIEGQADGSHQIEEQEAASVEDEEQVESKKGNQVDENKIAARAVNDEQVESTEEQRLDKNMIKSNAEVTEEIGSTEERHVDENKIAGDAEVDFKEGQLDENTSGGNAENNEQLESDKAQQLSEKKTEDNAKHEKQVESKEWQVHDSANEEPKAKMTKTINTTLKSRGSPGKRDSPGYNDVIEKTTSQLMAEQRKNRVKALVGAFETVIDYESK